MALGVDDDSIAFMFFSNTIFERLREACARFGCSMEPGVETAGVDSPSSVEVLDSSMFGVAAPLLSCVG